MTIIEKFEQLSPQQQQQTLLAIQKFGLDAFLADIGGEMTAEEKSAARDYFQAIKVELSDEEMEDATGGAGLRVCPGSRFESGFRFSGATTCCLTCKDFSRGDISKNRFYNDTCNFFDAKTSTYINN